MIAGSVSVKDTDPVVDIGPLEVTKTTEKRKPIPLLVSGGLMAVGLILTITAATRKH